MTEKTEPRWKQRYRAPSLTLPRWAPDDPEHLVYVSNLSGSWQVHAWDRAADRHRQVSDHPTGVVAAVARGAAPVAALRALDRHERVDAVGSYELPVAQGDHAGVALGHCVL